MEDRLSFILQRIDSRHFSKLWNFYRDYFPNDNACLRFFHKTLRLEPTYSKEQLEEKCLEIFSNDNKYIDPDDRYFIPRRMLNCVERMVSAARDMEQIRRGKDVFKIVFIVTCVETLQKLAGKTGQKKDMLFDFFKGYTSEKDKKYIRSHFAHGSQGLYDEDSFEQFVGVINEYRNCAAHEGEYWDYCFNNFFRRKPLSIIVKIDLDNYSMKNKKDHVFETTLSYRKFEEIFIRTCVTFIKRYVAEQEVTANADT